MKYYIRQGLGYTKGEAILKGNYHELSKEAIKYINRLTRDEKRGLIYQLEINQIDDNIHISYLTGKKL